MKYRRKFDQWRDTQRALFRLGERRPALRGIIGDIKSVLKVDHMTQRQLQVLEALLNLIEPPDAEEEEAPIPASLISAAAQAEEEIGIDELERYAEEQRRREQ